MLHSDGKSINRMQGFSQNLQTQNFQILIRVYDLKRLLSVEQEIPRAPISFM